MVTEQLAPAKPNLAELKSACKRHGITQDRIAEAAGVTRPLVVNVFAGRSTSRNVVETARRLVAEAELALKASRRRRRNGDAA